MKKQIFTTIVVCLCVLALVGFSRAAEITVGWDANPESDVVGYRVYQSTDIGLSWTLVADVNATTTTLSNVPDSGLILFRVSAYDGQSEAIRYDAGAWFNSDWQPLSSPKSSGIE